MTDLNQSLKNNAFKEIIDFLNRIAASGEPNSISSLWLQHLPFNVTFQELLDERNMTAKFMYSAEQYFVERRPLPGKR